MGSEYFYTTTVKRVSHHSKHSHISTTNNESWWLQIPVTQSSQTSRSVSLLGPVKMKVNTVQSLIALGVNKAPCQKFSDAITQILSQLGINGVAQNERLTIILTNPSSIISSTIGDKHFKISQIILSTISNARWSSQTGESTGDRPAFSSLRSNSSYNSYKATGSRIPKVTLSFELI